MYFFMPAGVLNTATINRGFEFEVLNENKKLLASFSELTKINKPGGFPRHPLEKENKRMPKLQLAPKRD